MSGVVWFFFFQAEDGIRDLTVTGVQTCALPISARSPGRRADAGAGRQRVRRGGRDRGGADRKSTRLNSSHSQISYAVFCLKKKKLARRAECSVNNPNPAYTHLISVDGSESPDPA